jgi:threonine dehydrogenase-like Zn-dependent dehydrogenase
MEKNMKAAVFYGKEDLRIEDVEIPRIKDGEILIKVHACGVCGTDVHIYDGDEGAAKSPAGTILGHEFAGEVTAVGSKVKNIKIGDRVCVDPNKLCNSCDYCRNGIGHFCENMIGIGTTVNGGFAQYCAVPEEQAYKFADSVTYEEAAMTEPVSCCLHGIDMCDINCGDTVAVIGGGMIGLLMLQLSRLKGASRLIMVEPVEEKRILAKKLGADLVMNPFEEDIKTGLKDNGIDRINTVVECVGSINTIKQAIEIAGKKSTVMMFGLTKPGEELPVKPFEIFKKEITLKASFINPYTQKRAITLIETKKIDVRSMVYKTAGLDELKNILSNKELRSRGKFIINPQLDSSYCK